ncbi:LPXTG cell wall anchor domain-containing protein, partial [Streptococcus pseudopneumoniae]|uniref:LPXTG cell wall anchor domain-containing protein n=1 Tax=Streptococcus pseudopneumoniae TaxID=257758 RepID=UPI000B194316
TAKDIKVNKDGSVVVTFEDGTTAFIPADKTVKSADSNGVQDPSTPATDASKNKVTDPAVTPVKDPANLTDAEKAKVAEEVKKSNPTAKDIKVNKDGSVVVTFEDGTTAVIPADKTVKSADSNGVQDPSATPANDQAAQKPAVAPATTPAAANASQTASAQANARQAAKELPNTGTANSTVAMVAAAASALLGLGLAGRRRKEDEEA